MCGIGGFYRHPGVSLDSPGLLAHMIEVQRHRGPDTNGQWMSREGAVGLCHTRLAILDLSPSGAQPMVESELAIVFNGEIYNWAELRADLEGQGHTFRGHSDTEVLLAGYRFYGEEIVARLRGMFAFAIYDGRDGSLFCARDRVGKKPFVYAETSVGFFFASEIPAVAGAPGVDTALDQDAIAGMFLLNMRHVVDPHTAYAGIRRLRAGHALRVAGARVARIWRWWTPEADTGPHSPQRLRSLLEDATRTRMVADVPVGALLSGGVDSTAIVSIMQRVSQEPVRTYALGLDTNDEDLRRARFAAQRLGCIHKEFNFEPGRQWEIFRQLIRTYGEPIMLLPLIHAFELCKAIREDGMRVVLVGHGADEIFYGYTGHFRTARTTDWLRRIAFLRHLVPKAIARSTQLPAAARFALTPSGERKSQYYRLYQAQCWEGLIGVDMQARLRNTVAEELRYWGELSPSQEFIDESNFCGLLVENTHSVTTSADLPAMLASVETRAPFLDPAILSFAAGVHYRDKVPRTGNSGQLKLILKKAVEDLVPPELLYASKRGFGMSIQEEMVFRGPWRSFAQELLSEPDDLNGLFDREGVRREWRRFCEGASGRTATIARLVAVQCWARDSRITQAALRRSRSSPQENRGAHLETQRLTR